MNVNSFSVALNEGMWVLGPNGKSCDEVCADNDRLCTSNSIEKQSSLTTNKLLAASMLEAGYTCKGYRVGTGYLGSPYSTGRTNDDCTPIIKGTKSVCNENENPRNRALCYCEKGMKINIIQKPQKYFFLSYFVIV